MAACAPQTVCVSAPILDNSNTSSNAEGVNSDGAVIVGSIGLNAVRWSAGVTANLGSFGGFSSGATGVSGDGSVVVGYSYLPGVVNINGSNYSVAHAFRWTTAGLVDLGTLGGPQSEANGISKDGKVIVGYSTLAESGALTPHAFRWTNAGMVDLGTLGGAYSNATATNSDGSVVVGVSTISSNANHAFRWTSNGMTDLGTLGGESSFASSVSTDGSVVIGYSKTSGDVANHSFRWTSAGMADLGTLGGSTSRANGISGNGAVIVGESYLTGNPGTPAFPGGFIIPTSHAYRWTSATGMRDLNTLLTSAGVNLSGIVLEGASAVSADGRYIVGSAKASGTYRAYIVKYDDGAGSAPVAGLTSATAQQQSVSQLASARSGVMIQQGAFVSPLLGADKPMEQGNNAGAFASAGSAAGGGFVRYSAGNGLALLGGLSYAQEDYQNAELRHGMTSAAALRYVHDTHSWWQPFIEAGGWLAPNASLSFSRTYENGASTTRATGRTNGDIDYVYARAGVVLGHASRDQLVISGELGRERAAIDGYAEPVSAQNPFGAVVSGGTDRMELGKVRLQWSHTFDDKFDGSVWVAGARAFSNESSLAATVGGVGTMTPASAGAVNFAEYGARVGYKLNDAITIDTFINGVSGSGGIDTRVHGGLGVRTQF